MTPVGEEGLNVLHIGRDVPVPVEDGQQARFEVVALQYAAAPEVADALNQLVYRGRGEGREPTIRIVTEQRMNALLLRAPPEHMAKLKDLISQLDVEVGSGG